MDYEKEYVEFLISESTNFPEIKPILENYLLDRISFNELIKDIYEGGYDVLPWKQFKKDKDINSLFD